MQEHAAISRAQVLERLARHREQIELDIVWNLATNRIPDLIFKIEAIRELP